MYVPALRELGLAELEHNARNNRMRAIGAARSIEHGWDGAGQHTRSHDMHPGRK